MADRSLRLITDADGQAMGALEMHGVTGPFFVGRGAGATSRPSTFRSVRANPRRDREEGLPCRTTYRTSGASIVP